MSADYKQLKKLQQSIERLEKYDLDAFVKEATNEIAQRLYAKAVKRTPVGIYDSNGRHVGSANNMKNANKKAKESSGKVGGTLRRGFRITKVIPMAGGYQVRVFNAVEYAQYVEFGHRTRGGGGWVNGAFMLTKSELEIEQDIPRLIERKLKAFLMEKLDL